MLTAKSHLPHTPNNKSFGMILLIPWFINIKFFDIIKKTEKSCRFTLDIILDRANQTDKIKL